MHDQYNAPLLRETGDKSSAVKENSTVAVQHLSASGPGKNTAIPAEPADVLDKPFVTVRKAAEILGVPLEVVVYDVHEGLDGKLGTLTGGIEGGYWLVQSSDLQGDSLAYHRERLLR